jgi:hypothetical protein
MSNHGKEGTNREGVNIDETRMKIDMGKLITGSGHPLVLGEIGDNGHVDDLQGRHQQGGDGGDRFLVAIQSRKETAYMFQDERSLGRGRSGGSV